VTQFDDAGLPMARLLVDVLSDKIIKAVDHKVGEASNANASGLKADMPLKSSTTVAGSGHRAWRAAQV
jgi:hypothetical protein